jgi:hypothetical protein
LSRGEERERERERERETEETVVRRGETERRERDREEKSLVAGSFDWWRAREGLAWYL